MQLLFNSVVAGSIYALVAIGFSLIFQTNRFMHFAHGSAVVFSAYIAFHFFSLSNSLLIAIIATLILSSILGYLMHLLIYYPLQKKKSSSVILLIASFGILFLIDNGLLLYFGSGIKNINYFGPLRGMEFFGALITKQQLIIVLSSLLCLIFIYLLMTKTKLGRNLRAVADNNDLANIMGIESKKYMALSFIIGSVLASVAGVLIALEQTLSINMGTTYMIKGFTGAIIGGVNSVPASILGSYIVGLAENFGVWFLPSQFKEAISFILLFLFLLYKPNGLFGIDKSSRK